MMDEGLHALTGALEFIPSVPKSSQPSSSPLDSPVVRRSLYILGGVTVAAGVAAVAGWRWLRSRSA